MSVLAACKKGTQGSFMNFKIHARLLHPRFCSLYLFAGIFIISSTALRTVLLWESITNIGWAPLTLIKIYAVGLFYDLNACSYIMLPSAVYLTLASDKSFHSGVNRWLTRLTLAAATFIVLFDVTAEWFFWQEFESRFNFIAIDYLVYTREVVNNITQSYPVKSIIGLLLLVSVIAPLLSRKILRYAFASVSSFKQRLPAGAAVIMLPILSFVFIGSSTADVSANRYANELSQNGLFDLVAAFINNSLDYSDFYVTADNYEVFGHVRELLKEPDSRFIGSNVFDINRQITNDAKPRQYNLIILTVESLSSEFLEMSKNGAPLTPNLNALEKDGLVFTNLYATGTRTVRGLEAIALSVPPIPGQSIIKRPHNENLFSIGTVLAANGYDLKFIYGGRGYFDNMNYFFANNGFQTIDQTDFGRSEIHFKNAWGVCDEDLYTRVLREADISSRQRKPFCSIVMTTSNHRPFTYPQTIDIPSGSGRLGAVKYTDYAIGEFLKQAEQKPWFDDTYFVIIADHCASSAGKTDLPVNKYHIPLIIYAPKLVQAAHIDKLASQIDVAPTLLDLLGISYESKFFGADLLKSDPHRALVSTYQKLGLFNGNKLSVLEPKKLTQMFDVDTRNGSQSPTAQEKNLLLDAISYYQSASYLFEYH
jgi:phosphoglycerol transferase MdoB-like AlkP superfamily enzyme